MRASDADPPAADGRVRVLVVGYGNPLRGDDGVGPYVAEKLSRQVRDPRVAVLVRHQLTPELAADLARADLVLFVDAEVARDGGAVRATTVVPRDGDTASALAAGLFHHVTPAALVALAGQVYGTRPRSVELFAVTAADFERRDALSAAVREAGDTLVSHLTAVIRRELEGVTRA